MRSAASAKTSAGAAGSSPVRARSASAKSVMPPPWPLWVIDLLKPAVEMEYAPANDALSLNSFDSSEASLIRARVSAATDLPPQEFQAATQAAYTAIAAELSRRADKYPVRFWNYIPDIHRPCEGGLDRYMVFNAGRFQACSQWLSTAGERFEQNLPTASGVGYDGPDLVIDALATKQTGAAVENPRQIPSYRYTRRYGPRPPCFARATLLENPETSRLLVGGTASIVGEESRHQGRLADQIRETLLNLSLLVQAAQKQTPIDTAAAEFSLVALACFTELRVYHPQAGDADTILESLAAVFPSARVEFSLASLCRSELLVEIEGVAQWSSKGTDQ